MDLASLFRSHSVAVVSLALIAFPVVNEAQAGGDNDNWPEIPPQAWLEEPRPDSGGADAIVLDEVAELKHEDDYTILYSRFVRIKVFTDAGHELAKFSQSIINDRLKIKNLRARSVRPDGSVTTLETDQIMETTILKIRGLDVREMSFFVPGVEPGSIVDIAYELTGFGAGWTAYIENPIYTLHSILTWYPSEEILEPGVRATWFTYGPRTSLMGVACNPNCGDPETIVLQGCCIPGFAVEKFAPPRAQAHSRFVLGYRYGSNSSQRHWTVLKRFLKRACAEYEKKMKPLEDMAEKTLEKYGDRDVALAKTYRWFQGNIRCIDELSWAQEQKYGPDLEANTFGKVVSIGELLGWKGYWVRIFGGAEVFKEKGEKPTAKRLLERKWGTEFEINLVFALIARELGFESCVAFVEDQRLTSFEPELTGLPPAHSLVAIRGPGNAWVYYQPASRFAPAASVPWWHRGERTFLVGKGRDLLTRIGPTYGVPGKCRWSLGINLDEHGSATGTVAGALGGEIGREYKSWLWELEPTTWPDELQSRLVGAEMPELDLERPKIPSQADSLLKISGRISYPKSAMVAGGAMTIAPMDLVPWRYKIDFDSEDRVYPILLRYPRDEVVECDLVLPEGAVVHDLPEAQKFSNALGTWTINWQRTPTGVHFTRVVLTDESYVEPKYYYVVREFFQSLDQADMQTVSLELR